ncbi:beta-ketoacyl synthase [Pseudoalteromonas ruthenica]|uniref:beta-ketoacyl synthase n=1 Tax=Pseudoalteromonas ruthenica TaxID=151081 RepID=UPI001107FA27|nr:beta-ketoacyl synthase [Pseudoalteromonas ruthenica]TLX51612.1 beta-ketoacyl synthase [Pseudoalteromonas ruthenica]
MKALPVIVAMGGINAAGRTSFNQGFRRVVLDALGQQQRQETLLGLAALMNLVSKQEEQLVDGDGNTITLDNVESQLGEQILSGTLIRRIEATHFDVDATHWQQKVTGHSEQAITFTTRARQLPSPVPSNWQITELDKGQVEVRINGEFTFKHDSFRDNPIKAAGQLPTGFDPSVLYNSRYQPRGLQATIFAASDAIHSSGLDWQKVMSAVAPDQIGTYSASVAGQVNSEGLGGLFRSRLQGDRVSTKQLALGLNTMSTDFINAYVTGSVGTTFTTSGACATFLYNLRAAVNDITAGRTRVAIVASSECAIEPEIIEGFGNMGALANDDNLKKLDNTDEVDYRRTSRPFGDNCGFTIGEGAQVTILMDDALALELGAQIRGSVPEVFVNADGYKKSITAPGPGNYITMAKSVALAQAMVGDESLIQRSFVLAHGSSTPQNRVTESAIYDRIASAYGIEQWPIVAPKAYVGHTIAPASGDQLAFALGVFDTNIMPGITTIDKVADDVHDDRLHISLTHRHCEAQDVAFINSKGFGGNNATAPVLSPELTKKMLAKRHGEQAMSEHHKRLQSTLAQQQIYWQQAQQGEFNIIYRFGEGLIDEADINFDQQQMRIPGFTNSVKLNIENPFADMK